MTTSRFQRPVLFVGVLAAMTSLATVGCGTGAGAASRHFAVDVSPGLVLATSQNTTAWEYGRNDGTLNIDQPTIPSVGGAVIITHDRRRTSNGRPLENSTTYTRTFSTRGAY